MTELFAYDNRKSAIDAASDYLIKQLTASEGTILLILSGGSSLNPVREAFKKLDEATLSRISIAQVDGVYSSKEDISTNWRQIKTALGKKMYKTARQLCILNHGDYPEDIAITYEMELRALLESSDETIGVYGIGSDGRLGGMLPTKSPEDFTKFVDGRLVVDYQAEDNFRITTTQALLTMLDEAVVFVCGSDKKQALSQLDESLPAYRHPAQFLKDAKRVTIFVGESDQ